jgi:ComF family protein
MSILDTFIGVVAPHDCLACGREGNLLCSPCSGTLQALPEQCYRCQTIMNKSLTCPACRQTSSLHSVQVAAVYGAVAKSLIWKLKLAGAQAAARIMAQRMVGLLPATPGAIIVPVPTATSRIRQRGYDQATLLARELSRQTRLPYYRCLARSGQTHQHGLRRQERLGQLTTAFRVNKPVQVRRSHIILVDDVTTTGATLEAAAAVLRSAGAARIEAVVFAQPQTGTVSR